MHGIQNNFLDNIAFINFINSTVEGAGGGGRYPEQPSCHIYEANNYSVSISVSISLVLHTICICIVYQRNRIKGKEYDKSLFCN